MDPRQRDLQSLQAAAESAARGDRAAFNTLHARLGPWLIHFFRTRAEQWTSAGGPNPADLAEDLSQRAWAAAWKSLSEGRYDPSRSAITTFIYSIAHHIWLQHGKTQRRRPPALSLEALSGEKGAGHDQPATDWLAAPEPADDAQLAELIDAVRRCVRGEAPAAGLTSEEGSILTGLSRGETDRALALRLGVSPSTAHARKRVALEKLRGFLANHTPNPDLANPARDRGAI